MSIMLGDESVVHHPKNIHKKLINDSSIDVHFDSGYASAASISYNQTDASASTSLKKSLEPIAENCELTFNDASGASIIETPTTKSIRQLNAFHIQTPQNDKRMMETTPTKANYFSRALRSSQKSSTKENRYSEMSPYKGTPNKRNGSGASYSSMHLFQDSVSENVENSFEMSANEPSIDYSPITNHNKSATSMATTMLDNNRRTLQRHPSGIESSTPISRSFKRTHTQTIAKTHFDTGNAANSRALKRKFKSFSPAKRHNVLKEISTNTPAMLERHDEQLEEDESVAINEHNPARKMLLFSSKQFDLLTAPIAPKPIHAASRIEPPVTPTKSSIKTRASTLQRQQCISFSPSPTNASPTRCDLANQSIQEEAMRRPMKKLKRSISYNPTTPNKGRIETEVLNTSVYCTPSRSPRRNALKRPATSAIGHQSATNEASAEPPAKRKLYYVGLEKLDILTRLNGANNVTDLILSMLSDKDLYASSRVCRSWSELIANNKSAHLRQLRYFRSSQSQKENANGRSSRTAPGPSGVHTNKRIPFAQRNDRHSLRSSPSRSPPVSPSKRKFHEHQKVTTDDFPHSYYSFSSNWSKLSPNQAVKKLKPGQRMDRCPRCDGPSIVHPKSEPMPKSPSPQKLRTNLLWRRKVNSLPTLNPNNVSLISIAKAWKSFDERKKPEMVLSEYGECNLPSCAYSYCTKCHCDRHVDGNCLERPVNSSSDEETRDKRPSDKRRALRRLLIREK